MKPKTSRRPALLTVAALVGSVVVVLALVRLVSHRDGAPTPVTAAAQHAPAPPAAIPREVDPTFPTPEQRARYFGAKVDGERRALRVVDMALQKAKAAGGDPSQIGKLEALRASYQERLRRHEAQLAL